MITKGSLKGIRNRTPQKILTKRISLDSAAPWSSSYTKWASQITDSGSMCTMSIFQSSNIRCFCETAINASVRWLQRSHVHSAATQTSDRQLLRSVTNLQKRNDTDVLDGLLAVCLRTSSPKIEALGSVYVDLMGSSESTVKYFSTQGALACK